MVTFQLDLEKPDTDLLSKAAAVVRENGIVAYPTDTLYGLAVNPCSRAAVAQLYRIKGRAVDRAIPLIGSALEQIEACAGPLSPEGRRLAGRFWPGPLTIVVPAWTGLDKGIHAGRGTVGIRVPAHWLARALAAACGWPITSTSANRSGAPASSLPADVRRALGADLDVLIDGGPTPGGPPSTVVDLSGGSPRLIRAGAVPWDRVLECLQ
jgi:L-threonylcarbamoyladenylate synthase